MPDARRTIDDRGSHPQIIYLKDPYEIHEWGIRVLTQRHGGTKKNSKEWNAKDARGVKGC